MYKKKYEHDYVCYRGYIMNTLSNQMYDLFRCYEDLVKIWNVLKTKYKKEKQGIEKLFFYEIFWIQYGGQQVYYDSTRWVACFYIHN
jgi:hypothetical protein